MSSTEEDPDFEFELDWNDDVGSTTVVDGPPPPILQHISPQHNKAPQQENIIPRYTAGPPDLTPPGLARTPPGLARTPPGLAHPSSGYARPPLGIPGPSGTQIQAEPSNRALTSSRQSGLSNQRASYPSGPLVVAGPSGLQRQTHPKPPNLVDIDTDATDDMIQTDNSRAIVRAKDNNGVNRKIPQGLKYQPASFGGYIGDDDDSPQPNQGAFSLPNIPRREDRYEEEDEYFGEHPTGFRRANEADVAERNGEPPNGVSCTVSKLGNC